ncbi:MAG: hypothetical protein KJO07_09190 [Deltaproteobacteria bacterium]|nr:hypothetical protein [Deltaproteobacteria bacterium]
MRWVLSILLVASVTCKKDPPAPTPSKNDSPPGPNELEQPKQDRQVSPPTHVLLFGHYNQDAQASFAALALANPEAPVQRYTQPAIPIKNWPNHYRVVAAVGRNQAFHAVKDGDSWKIARRDLKANKALPAYPVQGSEVSALLAAGSELFVGAGMSVGRMEVATGKFHELAKRPDSKWKAYDVLTRDGGMVVAIDDVVTPIWADLLWSEGAAWKREPWTMPSFINGTYKLAAVHFDDASKRDGTLYAIGDYGIMSGSGHDLTRLTIKGGKLQVKDGTVLNSSRLEDPPVLEEHTERGSGKVEKIIAGKEVTPWTGLAIVKDEDGKVVRLAIAAGKRGLLIVPADFTPDSKAEVVLLGSVHDVANIGDQLIALVGAAAAGDSQSSTRVVWLSPALEVEREVTVDSIYTRIVRDR